MTYGHLQADCMYTGMSSGPNARYRVWEAFTFTFYSVIRRDLTHICQLVLLLLLLLMLLRLRQTVVFD